LQGGLQASKKIDKKPIIKDRKCDRAADDEAKEIVVNLSLTLS